MSSLWNRPATLDRRKTRVKAAAGRSSVPTECHPPPLSLNRHSFRICLCNSIWPFKPIRYRVRAPAGFGTARSLILRKSTFCSSFPDVRRSTILSLKIVNIIIRIFCVYGDSINWVTVNLNFKKNVSN